MTFHVCARNTDRQRDNQKQLACPYIYIHSVLAIQKDINKQLKLTEDTLYYMLMPVKAMNGTVQDRRA